MHVGKITTLEIFYVIKYYKKASLKIFNKSANFVTFYIFIYLSFHQFILQKH